ncbi:hypothetical protein RD792_002675 [Penstemon davidsonii]|uniref:Transcriptional adapter n=1 Tax=Penstemon davidsonii TaxID=160366 RepID=A0ABR0DS42_9LAMI|nr:hypothetical protein RD792_002675 [Penstemon davidsonii]
MPLTVNWLGQGTSDGKRVLFHCNYCNKDITGKIRIKCAVCSDFDLCVECFSVGAEVQQHKSNHPYRVMDILSFPVICPEWSADEEMLLLEGTEMYGLTNWAEVAVHVGTKTKEFCFEHYRTAYLNSPYFPLPDMTQLVSKNTKELPETGKVELNEKSPFLSLRVGAEDSHKRNPSGRFPSTSIADEASERSYGNNQSKSAKAEPPLVASGGYNPKRHEFDVEYDNDAEHLLTDMEFNENDTQLERELKLRVLRTYSKRLEERQRRKDFIVQRNLLHASPFMMSLSPEEKALCRRHDVFMRFHPKEEHEVLLESLVSEHRTLKRIQELREARAAGCRTKAEADVYNERKRRASARRKESSRTYQSSQSIPVSSDSFGTYSSTTTSVGQANSSTPTSLDYGSMPGASLLTESEIHLCRETRLAPSQYLKMQEELSIQIFRGNVTKKSDASSLFQIEPNTIDRVYDMLVNKGIAR